MHACFIGTGEIGLPSLPDADQIGQAPCPRESSRKPDRPVGRQLKLAASHDQGDGVQGFTLKIFQPEKIGAASSVAQLKYPQEATTLIVVAAYGQILPKEILNLPHYGCLNLHTSLLPKYRASASPIHAAIAAGEPRSGVTIMWMDEGLDTGDILLQGTLTLRRHETAETLHDRLATIGADALVEAINLIEGGKAPRIQSRTNQEGDEHEKLKKEDGHINWDRPQKEIDAHIRAMTPWPSAYAWVPQEKDHKMLKIFTTILSHRAKGKPGEIVRVDKHGILVAAGVGGLLLREVQLEGKKRMHAAEFARGFNLPVGLVLE